MSNVPLFVSPVWAKSFVPVHSLQEVANNRSLPTKRGRPLRKRLRAWSACAPQVESKSEGKTDAATEPLSAARVSTEEPQLLVEGPALSPRVLIGEFIATFIFVNANVINAAASLGTSASAGANAALIAALAASLMTVSGAHLNFAVTAALTVTNHVPPSRAIAFLVIQLAASVAATFLAGAIGIPVASTFAQAAADGNIASAVWFEMMPIAIIVLVLYQTAVATPAEGGVGPQLAAIYIAAAVFGCASTFKGFFNPVLAFGRAVYLSAWDMHWIYWTPVPAAIAAALFCEHQFVSVAGKRKPSSWLASFGERLGG